MKIFICIFIFVFTTNSWSQTISLPLSEYAKNAINGKSPSEGWMNARDKSFVSSQTKSQSPVYVKVTVLGSSISGCARIRFAITQHDVPTSTPNQTTTFHGGWDMNMCVNADVPLFKH